MEFKLPEMLLRQARLNSWGPAPATDEESSKSDIPYMSYNKSERLGRVADWYQDEQQTQTHSQRQSVAQAANAGFASLTDQAEDQSFSQVGYSAPASAAATGPAKPAWGQRKNFGATTSQPQQPQQPRRNDAVQRKKESSIVIQPEYRTVHEYQMFEFNKMTYDDASAAKIGKSLAARAQQNALSGGPELSQDLHQIGTVFAYDRQWDRMAAKSNKPLVAVKCASESNVVKKIMESPSLLADTELAKLLSSDKLKAEADLVLIAAPVLAAIMTLPRSIQGWDIVVTKQTVTDANGNVKRKLWFDRRDTSTLDLQFVHETAQPHPVLTYANPGSVSSVTEYAPFDINSDKDHAWSPLNLARETTQVSKLFAQLPLQRSADKLEMGGESIGDVSKAYRYRTWDLSPPKGSERAVQVVVRTEVDAYLAQENTDVSNSPLVHIRALTEHFPIDPRGWRPVQNYTTWATKFAKNQRGAVQATEMRSNAYVWGRWCCEAYLAGAEYIKIGFAWRVGGARGYMPADKNTLASQSFAADGNGIVRDGQYVVLGTQNVRCQELAQQLNLSVSQCWGIFKTFVDLFLQSTEDAQGQVSQLPDGRYIIWRDPNVLKVKCYAVPESAVLE